MNWKDFFQARFETLCLIGLLFLMMAVHGFMMHYNRPAGMITWVEGFVTGIFAALLTRLNPPK